RKLVVIKRVQGLAELHEHKVGDVDNVVNGPQADGLKAFAEPLGRGANLDVADDAGCVIRTAGEVLNFDLGERGCGGCALRQREPGHGESTTGEGGKFTGEADVGEAVGAVGSDFDVEDLGGAFDAAASVMDSTGSPAFMSASAACAAAGTGARYSA